MKKLSVFLVAALALVSCSKKELEPSNKQVQLTVNVSTSTKVSTNITDAQEKAVHTIQIFVFDANGKLEVSSDAVNAEKVTLPCTFGSKTIAAVVNSPKKTVATLDELYASTTDLSENNVNPSTLETSFVMFGQVVGYLVDQTSSKGSVNIPVSRLVSKIVVKEISRNFENATDAARTVKIDGVAIKYAARNTNFLATSSPKNFYNIIENQKLDRPANVVNMTTNYNLDLNLANGATVNVGQCFYLYPNDNKTSASILAISTKVSGYSETRYYPIRLPEILPNKIYNVTLLVKRVGGQYDDKDTIEFGVEVQDWDSEQVDVNEEY